AYARDSSPVNFSVRPVVSIVQRVEGGANMKRQSGLLLIIGLVLTYPGPTRALGFQSDKSSATTQTPGRQTEAAPRQTSSNPLAPPPAEGADKSMSPDEANAAVDKLRETLRDSMRDGRGAIQNMDPEAQKQFAQTADKLLSDPLVKSAIARQIRDFRAPWQQ